MKKLMIFVALLVAGVAGAQDVDKLAEKYTGKEGVTVIKMDGDMVKILDGRKGLKINGVDVSQEFKDVKSVTMIVDENGDPELARELRLMVDGKDYTPLMDVDSSDERVRIAKKDGEMVITVVEGKGAKNLFIRLVGDSK